MPAEQSVAVPALMNVNAAAKGAEQAGCSPAAACHLAV